jgi:hypothetical protein
MILKENDLSAENDLNENSTGWMAQGCMTLLENDFNSRE